MSIFNYTESDLEQATLEWLEELGYQNLGGPYIAPAPDGEDPEREDYADVVLVERLKAAIKRINPKIPADTQQEALKKILNVPLMSPSLMLANRTFHKMLTDGVDVEFKRQDGSIAGDKVYLIDKHNWDNNDWLAVNQFTVIENKHNRRPDIVVFVNGLPLAVIELKNPTDEKATIKHAFNQLQTYKSEIPSLFAYNTLLIASDGNEAKVGSLSANYEWFMRWRTIDGFTLAPNSIPQLEVLIKGLFSKLRLLEMISDFVVFETDGEQISKKIAGYHQYHATKKAIEKTLQAIGPAGDKRGGVVWHTQGSGKSLTMLFYAGKLIQALDNPTIVVLTDRNDLDEQLFGTFSRCKDLLRQTPVQANDRKHLKELLKVAAGGVVFTTIQKFFPENKGETHPLLSERKNIVVIADEAHRSQYDFIDGFAKHMRDALPNASFIGYTGTPIEKTDANTRAVFGDYIDVYDITRAVEDKATVPIYYEARLAKISLLKSETPKIDPKFEEVTEGEEVAKKEKLKSKWARFEAMVGSEKRVKLVAKDIVNHFESRSGVIEGKGMIVAMSRRIAVELYDEIIKLRSQWHNKDGRKGFLKVVMTGSASDPLNYQQHIRNKKDREGLASRMKDPDDDLKLVIVRDMWLTGFDVPALHTMYFDKPMKGHGLMQAIARVNRVYKDKQGGLIVDYLGLAPMLKEALAYYADSESEKPTIPQEEAVAVMIEKYEIAKAIFHDFNYSDFFSKKAVARTSIIPAAMDFILGLEDGRNRYIKAVTELSHAFSLSVPHEETKKIRDEVAFFQAVKAGIVKMGRTGGDGEKPEEEFDLAIKQIISNAVISDKVIDIFSAAGLKRPEIGILSDEFLQEVKGLKHKNLALELLKKLLSDSIKVLAKKNLVKSRSFAKMLEETIRKYQNQTIEAAQVIVELVKLAKNVREEQEKGKDLGLSDDEVAFYDALAENESAVKRLGDQVLKKIAQELVVMLRKSTTVDWTLKENVRAQIRVYVKRLLRKYKYPPDKQESATKIVLEQAELLCRDWSNI